MTVASILSLCNTQQLVTADERNESCSYSESLMAFSLSARKVAAAILYFHLPLMVPVAPHIRLVQDDSSYISLQGIYEDFCRKSGMSKDEPVLFTMEKLRAMADVKQTRNADQMTIMRTEILTSNTRSDGCHTQSS